jgi:hypothetical protein
MYESRIWTTREINVAVEKNRLRLKDLDMWTLQIIK